jgi:hypothetical protein
MRSPSLLAGAITFALLSLGVPPARADFIPWTYGTISKANGSFGEDGTYEVNISTLSGTDGLNIGNGAHIPAVGDLVFSARGSVVGLGGWYISGGPVFFPSGRVLSFGPPQSTYALYLVIQDGPSAARGWFQFPGYFQGTLGDNGSTPVNVFTGSTTQAQLLGGDWYHVHIRYEDGISEGFYQGAFLLDVAVDTPEPSSLTLLASSLCAFVAAVVWRRAKNWHAILRSAF